MSDFHLLQYKQTLFLCKYERNEITTQIVFKIYKKYFKRYSYKKIGILSSFTFYLIFF